LSQSYTEFEYLISDDCSIDNTWEIIQEYKDPRIKAWRNKKNIGEYPNRNKTLEQAKGEYIIWIDGDDILYPHGLEFMVKMLDAFPASSMLSSRPFSEFIIYPYELSSRQIFQLELMGSPVLVNGFPDTLFKTHILKEAKGFPLNYISGDVYVKRFISTRYPSVFVSDSVSWWRRTEHQASSKLNSSEGIIQTFKMQIEFIEHAKSILNEKEIQYAMDRFYSGFVRFMLRKYLIKFKIFEALAIVKALRFNLFIWSYLFKKRPPEFKLATSTMPLQLSFDKNPYAANFEIL
jgi:glycosyltransferase involved in cell wall biosynthesis